MSPLDERRTTIERYIVAYNGFDIPGMLAVLHPEVEFRNIASGEVTVATRGRDEFRALAEHAAGLFRSRHQVIREYAASDDAVLITVDYVGVLAADLGPELHAGDTLRLTGRSTFEFRDDLIARLIDES